MLSNRIKHAQNTTAYKPMVTHLPKGRHACLALLLICFAVGVQAQFTPMTIAGDILHVQQLHATDIDGDGDLDIFVSTYSETPTSGPDRKAFRLFWLENDDGVFSAREDLFNLYGGDFKGIDFAIHDQQFDDLDGDSLTDVLTSSFVRFIGVQADGVQWHRNLGGGDFQAHVIDKREFGDSFGSPLLSDMDSDHTPDILVQRYGKVIRYAYDGRGQDRFGPAELLSDQTFDKLFSEDIDADGHDDLVTLADGALYWIGNDGQGSFSADPLLISDGLVSDQLLFTDIDRNGFTDLVAVVPEGGVSWWPNNGDGSFASERCVVNFTGPVYDILLDVADVDGDGDRDLILHSDLDGLQWFKNDGSEIFDMAFPIASTPARAMQVLDFDGDQFPDILCAHASGELVLYRNGGDSTLTSTVQILERDHGIAVSVFPNPMTRASAIYLSDLPSFPIDVVLYDAAGKPVQRQTGLRQNRITFARQDLPAGLYVIHLVHHQSGKALGGYPLLIE